MPNSTLINLNLTMDEAVQLDLLLNCLDILSTSNGHVIAQGLRENLALKHIARQVKAELDSLVDLSTHYINGHQQ